MKDLHSRIKPFIGVIKTSVGNETLTSAAIDLAGYQSVELVVQYGTKTDGLVAVKLTECATLAGVYTDVAAADYLGSAAAVSAADGAAGSGTIARCGYRGALRFLKVVVDISSNAGSCPVAACFIGSHANHGPVA